MSRGGEGPTFGLRRSFRGNTTSQSPTAVRYVSGPWRAFCETLLTTSASLEKNSCANFLEMGLDHIRSFTFSDISKPRCVSSGSSCVTAHLPCVHVYSWLSLRESGNPSAVRKRRRWLYNKKRRFSYVWMNVFSAADILTYPLDNATADSQAYRARWACGNRDLTRVKRMENH